MDGYAFTLEFKVRDYECDIEGIVNNAVYMNYLEHARHEFMESLGINFAELAKKDINLIVVRAELDYKFPLRSGDRFLVGINIERESRLRICFVQDIIRIPDDKPVLKARITGSGINAAGRPSVPQELIKALGLE